MSTPRVARPTTVAGTLHFASTLHSVWPKGGDSALSVVFFLKFAPIIQISALKRQGLLTGRETVLDKNANRPLPVTRLWLRAGVAPETLALDTSARSSAPSATST